MTQQMKVTINQWLITAVAAVIAFVSAAQLLKYKVEENRKDIDAIEIKVCSGQDQRTAMKNQDALLVRDVAELREVMKDNEETHVIIKNDINSILAKIE